MSQSLNNPFDGLPRKHFRVVYADPPWRFQGWVTGRTKGDGTIFTPSREPDYPVMPTDQIAAMPVDQLVAKDCVLFLWGIWFMLPDALEVIKAWGFKYKTCAFNWSKAKANQLDMFRDDLDDQIGQGYWTRQSSEFCLLATRGKPKRKSGGVRQGIIEPRREHSRKPDCIYERIERLVDGPYIELFARRTRPNWTSWGKDVGKFDPPYNAADDFGKSIDVAYEAVRQRVANGGPPWIPKTENGKVETISTLSSYEKQHMEKISTCSSYTLEEAAKVAVTDVDDDLPTSLPRKTGAAP